MVGFEELIEMIQTGEPAIYNHPYHGKSRYDYIDGIIITNSKPVEGGKMQLKAHLVRENENCSLEGYAKYIERVV